MTSHQFAQNELGVIFEKFLPVIKRNKFKSFILLIIFLFYFSIPSFQIPFLAYGHFRFTSLMDERALQNDLLFYPNQSWVSINDVNPNLLKGIVAMEDDSFFEHKGIDWKQIKTTIRTNRRRGKIVRGASTITMQLAKNLYLTTNRNFIRKAKEMLIAFRMEKELTKKEILQDYINAIELGNGIFGVKEASEIYFHKEPKNLTLDQCARLAAVIPSPLRHAPNTNSNYVLRRSYIVKSRWNNVVLFPEN